MCPVYLSVEYPVPRQNLETPVHTQTVVEEALLQPSSLSLTYLKQAVILGLAVSGNWSSHRVGFLLCWDAWPSMRRKESSDQTLASQSWPVLSMSPSCPGPQS